MGRGLSAVRITTSSDELAAIAAEARNEIASSEARLRALHQRAQEVASASAREQAEFKRTVEQFGFELSSLQQHEYSGDHGTGPLFDLEAMQQSAKKLEGDVARANALESNLSIVLHVLQDAGAQLTPDRAFARILDTADLRLQQAMNSAREDERRRLAREIHDGPAQVLSNAIFAVHTTEQIARRAPHQVVEELAQLRELLKDGVAEIRRFMFDLRPTMLQDLGLGPTLARYVDDYSRFFAKKVTLRTDEALPHLTPDQELTIFRIVQEALQNIHKHAGQGAEAQIALGAAAGIVQLTINDNGKGFDPHSVVPRATSGAGLPGMRERANLAGGELNVDSDPGNGTTITLRMPLRGQTGPLRMST